MVRHGSRRLRLEQKDMMRERERSLVDLEQQKAVETSVSLPYILGIGGTAVQETGRLGSRAEDATYLPYPWVSPDHVVVAAEG